jgi:hypothetical protein
MSRADSEKGAPDWERIECDYRAGILSLREIAAHDGNVTHQAIAKRAKRDGWEQDLTAKIKAKADALVAKQLVDSSVDSSKAATAREVIEANAARIAQVRGEHRSDITRSRNLTIKLLAELESTTDNVELFEQLGVLMLKPDDKGVDKLNELYHKVISLPSRVGSMKTLSDALKTLIGLEREAYGLANSGGGEGKPAEVAATLDVTGLDTDQVRAIANIRINGG